jgi:integrase
MEREIQFRDGLIIALLSLWPIRRRSLGALGLERHVKRLDADDRLELLLYPEDTKTRQEERWPVPETLHSYVRRYLDEIRPRLVGRRNHDAFWVGQHGHPLSEDGLYDAVRRRTAKAFGTTMALHDFRRSAATFIATEVPEKVGLVPGILQHRSPETADRYYNLARSASASRRHSETLSALKERLRPVQGVAWR